MLDQSRFLLYLKVFALKMLTMPFPPLYAFRGGSYALSPVST
jgi:hypothetical protein